MQVPNRHLAVVDIAKLRDYCLSPAHRVGRHKAKVFASALGLSSADAPPLRRALLESLVEEDAAPGAVDGFGRRFTVDFEMAFKGSRARVRG